MVLADRSSARDMELMELLLEMDQWFGTISLSKRDSVFTCTQNSKDRRIRQHQLINIFNTPESYLFNYDSSKGLILLNDSGYSYVNNYKKLQEINSVCVKHRNTSVSVIPSIIVLITVFIGPFII